MPDKTMSYADAALLALECFEVVDHTVTNDYGNARYARFFDDPPDPTVYNAVYDAVCAAHDGRLPDDWTFATFYDALQWITESDATDAGSRSEFAETQVCLYDSELLTWLRAYPGAPAVCDAAAEHADSDDTTTIRRIMCGQYVEAARIFDHAAQLVATIREGVAS